MTRRSSLASRTNSRYLAFWVGYGQDCIAWLVSLAVVCFVDRDAFAPGSGVGLAVLLSGVLLAQLIIGSWISLYSRRDNLESLPEFKALIATVLLVVLFVGAPGYLLSAFLSTPPALVIWAAPLALLLHVLVRYRSRLGREVEVKRNESAQRTLVFGAGYLGRQVVRVMLTDRTSPYEPVGLIDDDPSLLGAKIDGVPVLGSLADLAALASTTEATAVVVSIARADGALLRQVSDLCEELGMRVLVFPSLEEVLEGKSRLRDVRDISIEDLIGRHPIETDVESMAGYLTGKRVLVTGAGGSIGTELCRQIMKYVPDELILLDRDETGLQGTQLLIEGNGLLVNKNIVLADIRDPEALRRAFEERRPHVVFHAAALKHLPLLERFPAEAWKTNVVGTLNVLEAAIAANVETFVNVSTDKAADPTSVLGYSKKFAERLTAWAAVESGCRYLSVRFGNVLGSRGSMVPVFAAMIEAGGPLTVTHPDVTRFFMTIPEACHLVVQAGGIGQPGEVLILDMGQPVRILDIAERMITKSGRDVAIVFTGLREGEKLHEDLVGAAEEVLRPVHPKIAHTRAIPISPEEVRQVNWLAEIGRRSE